MKVLVLAPSIGSVGGVQQYTTTLASALETILGKSNTRMAAVPAEPKLLPGGTLALSRSVKVRYLLRVVGESIRWRPDLIICTHLGVAQAARTTRWVFGIPYWIVLHGIEVWGDLPPAKLQALRHAERLVANSRFTLDATVSRHSLQGMQSSVLPPAFQEIGHPTNSATVEDSPPFVLTVGRLASSERYKGHDVMLEAWVEVHRAIPSAIYRIVGDGDDRSRLEARAGELGISDSVQFAGTLSGAALRDAYEKCNVFALPSRTDLDPRAPRGEGFGIVFLEAMAHGKPVVGPKSGAPSEFIHDGEHGILVDPTKCGEVARALLELLQQPERARHMGLAASEWVKCEFSFECFCGRLKAMIAPDKDPKTAADN
jgi:phosphatidylinositol alpha-1,6-mannosyltransferase